MLGLYLTLAPYGGNLEGIRAASLAYFGKEPKKLSLAEAALLVALPQSPELRRPDRSVDAARARRATACSTASPRPERFPRTKSHSPSSTRVAAGRRPMPALAPHAADQAIAALPKLKVHRLTIDAGLQKNLEDLARERAKALGPNLSVAILAVDNATGEVLARVASSDYFDERRAGQVDMTDALRSPGSALKPFIYGLAFEDGIAHPETLIEDRPVRYGAYAPENFDLTFQGTVTARRALQLSLNVPAVALLDGVGASRLNARISQAGGTLVLPKGEAPGLAMALGGLGIKLSDLTMLYVGLARGGNAVPLTERITDARSASAAPAARSGRGLVRRQHPDRHAAAGECRRRPHRLQDRHVLRLSRRLVGRLRRQANHRRMGRPARRRAGRGPDRTHRGGADPVRRLRTHRRESRRRCRLRRAACCSQRAANCRRRSAISARTAWPPPTTPAPPLRIAFPPNNSRVELTTYDGKPDPLALKITGGVEPLTVLVNGVPASARADRRTLFVDPDGPGFLRLTVIDAKGAADSVMVRLQ